MPLKVKNHRQRVFARNMKQKGFTLIEIVIALAIVAVATLAIANAMNQHINTAAGLEQRLLASWVASNTLAEVRYEAKIGKVKTGSRSETVELGGRRWKAQLKIKKTEVERVFLVTVEVIDDARREDPPFASLTSAVSDSF
jgi:general secretion pathway protein I